MSSTIRFEIDSDGIAILTIDVPGRSMNVMTPEYYAELAQSAARLRAETTIRGAVITSAKPAFLAGADLKARR